MTETTAIFIVSLAVLLVSGGWAVKALIVLGSILHVKAFFVGFMMMAVATSMPELFVGINAALIGEPILSLGNAFGSLVVNLGLIAGILALITGHIRLEHAAIKQDIWVTIGFGLLPFLLGLDGAITRADGGVLLIGFFAYFILLAHQKRLFEQRLDGDFLIGCGGQITALILSGILMIGSARFLVDSGVTMAQAAGIPSFLLGLLVISLGTSLPELSFAIRSAQMGKPELSIGDLLGASVIDVTLVLGITALIRPIEGVNQRLYLEVFIASMVIFLLFAFLFRRNAGIHRFGGALLVGVYIVYLISTLVQSIYL